MGPFVWRLDLLSESNSILALQVGAGVAYDEIARRLVSAGFEGRKGVNIKNYVSKRKKRKRPDKLTTSKDLQDKK